MLRGRRKLWELCVCERDPVWDGIMVLHRFTRLKEWSGVICLLELRMAWALRQELPMGKACAKISADRSLH